MKFNPIIFLFIFSFFMSCEKDDLSVKENIIDKKWAITNIELEVNDIKTDVTSLVNQYIEACFLDNEMYFHEDGTFRDTEGPVKCHQDGPEILGTGTWAISDDEKTLTKTYDVTDLIQIWTIESSKSKSLVLSTNDDLFQLGQGTTYITLEPQE